MDRFIEFTKSHCREIADRCTACGRCAQACPTVPLTGLANIASDKLAAGLIELSRGNADSAQTTTWLNACNSSGLCNDVCPEGINVRSWIGGLRTLHDVQETDARDRRKKASDTFRAMSQAIRLLVSMQLPPETIERVTGSRVRNQADVIFYTGCNVLRTPHIVMNMIEILDCLGISYEIIGGTSYCCGVTQHRNGDISSFERIAGRTSNAFAEMKSSEIISWCPTCLLQFNENWVQFEKPDYSMAHVTNFLHKHLDQMRNKFVDRPRRRIVLQEHDGIPNVTEHVEEILTAIPYIELVKVPQNRSFGYVCGGIGSTYPELQRENYKRLLDNAQASQADCVSTIYHSCHRMLAGAATKYPFDVLNFTDLIVEALGLSPHRDIYGTLAQVENMDTVIDTVQQLLAQNGVNPNREQIEAVARQMFNEPGFYGSQEEFVNKISDGAGVGID